MPLKTNILQYVETRQHVEIPIILLKGHSQILDNEKSATLGKQAITNININTIYYESISFSITCFKSIIKVKIYVYMIARQSRTCQTQEEQLVTT